MRVRQLRRRRSGKLRLGIEPLEQRLLLANWSGDIFDAVPGTPLWTNDEVQRIVGDVHVPAGKTLTIEPGTIVKFRTQQGDDLLVDGTLLADGTAAQPIIFTSDRDDTGLDGLLGT
ncbi:MAG: hypothetical protein HYV60_02880, partial [Planctomycetia bacterium]|nr:hypothetical protein [Planctomycetia bacterium]